MLSRRLIVFALVVLGVSYLLAGGLGQPTTTPADGERLDRSRMVQPVDNGSYLWPYTSRERSPDGRTLATNIVILDEHDRVRRALTERTSLNWEEARPANATTINATTADPATLNETAANATANMTVSVSENATAPNATAVPVNESGEPPLRIDESAIEWNDAHGSTRYSYIDARPRNGSAVWVDEAFQIHAGDYFGSRHHIRAYTTPAAEWTAIQVHQEYWDWFRLRHTVTDIQQPRNVIESEFLGQPYVERVSREYYGVDRGWNDGWLSVIELVPGLALLLAGAVLSGETRRSLRAEARRFLGWAHANVRGFVLATALVALYLGVRTVGILMETTIPNVDPRVFLAVLYPAVAVGIPVLTFAFAQPYGATSRFDRLQWFASRIGSPLDPLAAFGFAFVGLGAAFVLDFGGLGIVSIPVQLALHRVGLLFALGMVAAGAAQIEERGPGLLLLGAGGWVLGLLMPLFGYL